MEIKQQLKLSQHLVMTPQLQQAIRLLQLNQLELRDEISHELENNPVLADELTDPKQQQAEGADAPLPGSTLAGEERVGVTELAEQPHSIEERVHEKQVAEVDWEQFLENRTQQQALPTTRGGFEELPPIEANLTKLESLEDHLLWQVQNSDFNEEERNFAELVIGNLDDRGFLDLKGIEREDGTRTPDLTIEDLAREAGLDPEDADEVLKILQQMDPVGVCCRDLRECLKVQAELYGYDDSEIAMIDRHLHNLEKRNWGAIAKDLKVSVEEVVEAAKQIQKLESRPARNFTTTDEKSIAITPDVYVMKDGEKWIVVDNDKGLQRLYINEALAKRLLKDPQAKEFIGEKLRNAQWLIRAIEQRRKTIIRVTECIVEKQKEFFERGVAFLKPMILRDVAETVGMHESTISRVTTNKYVHTPQGLFELKYFFNSAIRRTADEDIASEAVKQAIKRLIENEDKENPLSDQAIVELLERNEGIQIARRTVAKYREVMGILASSKRKKMF
ncbi:MAG: RNA polymerase factor sigma-54 [Deltaproteobacteria bacterium]|nr:RNA polymerase factor sigma-54 [Deltaproteobacteria bacterium]